MWVLMDKFCIIKVLDPLSHELEPYHAEHYTKNKKAASGPKELNDKVHGITC